MPFVRTDGTLTKKQAAQRRETAKAPKSTEEEREKCALCLEKVLCVEQRASRLGRVRCQALHAAFCWPCIEHLARTPTMWPTMWAPAAAATNPSCGRTSWAHPLTETRLR